VIYEVIVLQMMKQLEVQKHQPNISNYQLKTIQQELVLIQVAKKGHIRKKFIPVSGVGQWIDLYQIKYVIEICRVKCWSLHV